MTALAIHTVPDIHRLWQTDQPAIRSHFLRLDSRGRRMRFCGAVSQTRIEHYAGQLFQPNSFIFGAFPDGRLRAIAELHMRSSDEQGVADAAFSVEPEWQDQGIGNALLNRVVTSAQNRSVTSLYMMCLVENEKMRHLASKHHAMLEIHSGEVEAWIHPPWPTALSIFEEASGEFLSLAHAVLRRQTLLPDLKPQIRFGP